MHVVLLLCTTTTHALLRTTLFFIDSSAHRGTAHLSRLAQLGRGPSGRGKVLMRRSRVPYLPQWGGRPGAVAHHHQRWGKTCMYRISDHHIGTLPWHRIMVAPLRCKSFKRGRCVQTCLGRMRELMKPRAIPPQPPDAEAAHEAAHTDELFATPRHHPVHALILAKEMQA